MGLPFSAPLFGRRGVDGLRSPQLLLDERPQTLGCSLPQAEKQKTFWVRVLILQSPCLREAILILENMMRRALILNSFSLSLWLKRLSRAALKFGKLFPSGIH